MMATPFRESSVNQAFAADDPYLGREFGPCRIDQKLAVGGYGVVYKATDVNLGIPRAVKFFHPHLSSERGFRERFYNEMQLLAKMDHPNIVKIVFAIDEPNLSGFVMEFVEGQPLSDILDEQGRLEVTWSREVFRQVGGAIRYAHTLDPPIIHRDLSPDNIMVRPDGSAKIMDFGISKTINAERLTQTGIVLGKPMYMAPEQFEGQVTELCDQYALGIILYEMIVGDLPFEGDTPIAQYRARYKQQVALPADLAGTVPPEIVDAILRCTKMEPQDRFSDVGAMIDSLEVPGVAVSGSVPRAKSPAEVLEEIRLKVDLKNYQEAADDLEAFLIGNPGHPQALALQNDVRRKLKARQVQRTMRNASKDAVELHRSGDIHGAREQVETFLACTRKFTDSPPVLQMKQALATALPGLYDEVVRGLRGRDESVRETMREARDSYRAKNFTAASASLERLLGIDPQHEEGRELQSLCHRALRRDQIDAYFKSGVEGLRREDYEGALAAFDFVLSVDPDHQQAARYRDLAQAQIDEIEAERERQRSRSAEVEQYFAEGKSAYQNWNYPEAIRFFRMVLATYALLTLISASRRNPGSDRSLHDRSSANGSLPPR